MEDFTDPLLVNLSEHFTDPDGDAIFYNVSYDDSQLDVSLEGGIVRINSVADWYGVSTIEITAQDSSLIVLGEYVETSFNVILSNINDDPIFSSTPDTTVLEDMNYDYYITTVDIDSEISISATSLPDWMHLSNLENGTAILQGVPTNDDVGENLVELTIIEDGNPSVTQEFILNVINVNDRPVIDLPYLIEFDEDTSYSLDLKDYIHDDDNSMDELDLYIYHNNQIGYTVDDWVVTFASVNEHWYGVEFIKFMVMDPFIPSERTVVYDTMYVKINSVEDHPYLENELPEINLVEDFYWHSIILDDYFTDPEGDYLFYDVQFVAGEIDCDISSGDLVIRSVDDWFGTTHIILTVKDNPNSGYSLIHELDITIYPENDSPEIEQNFADLDLNEDFGALSFDLNEYFYDIDNENLTYSVNYDENNLRCVIYGHHLLIESIDNWYGETSFEIICSDNVNQRNSRREFRNETDMRVEVNVAPVNDIPTIESFIPAETQIYLSQTDRIIFEVEALDLDSELDFEWTVNEEIVEHNDSLMTYDFIENGDYLVKVKISDEQFSIEKQWNIEVYLVDNEEVTTPKITKLLQNTPNPFNPTTTINFNLHKQSKVRIDVYNAKGQLVTTLKNETMSAGSHQIQWNGNSRNNQQLSSGIYFVRLQTDDYSDMKKMLMLK
jgi:hypothetical protein